MFDRKTVRDIDINDKVVLVRAGYDVPMNASGEIVDDLRIRASLETLKYLIERDARKIVIISHQGRPEGKVVPGLSLRPVASRLAELMPGVEIGFVPYVVGPEAEMAVQSMNERGILLLENLRFEPGEEEDSEAFATALVDAVRPDMFVQDGFAVVHRAHASTDAICKLVPSVAGLLLEREVENLSVAREPISPSVCIMGGAKVEDKAPLIEKFAGVYDQVFVGGKIANEYTPAGELNVTMPVDFVRGEDDYAYDIGPESTAAIVAAVGEAQTVLWNGTLGMAEKPEYAVASAAVAKAVGSREYATTVVAGGDTTAFVEEMIRREPGLKYSLISTGGGAALEFLLGEKLPGIEALELK